MIPRIGLLLPRSALYPAMNFDILGGVRAGFETAGQHDVHIVTENIGTATNDEIIYAHCERMLIEGASVVMGYVNPQTTIKLQPLFAAAGAVFIALDSGYHFLTGHKLLPNIVFLSLQSALCCRMVTELALKEGARSFSFVTSFYDAGYRSAYAMARAVERGGGQILFNHVTALKRGAFTLNPLVNFVTGESEKTVIAAFCADMAADFLSHIRKHGVQLHLFAGPFMGEETWISNFEYPGMDYRVCIPWSLELDSKANQQFVALMNAAGRAANIFSLLGYEAAQLTSVLIRCGKRGAQAAAALHGIGLESPRGTLTVNADTQQTIAPVYEAVVIEAEGGRCRLELKSALPDVQAQWQFLQEDIAAFGEVSNNWFNTYPCIDS